jgi:hypothetical protein
MKKYFFYVLSFLIIPLNSLCQIVENKEQNEVSVYDYRIWLSDINKIDLRDSNKLFFDTITFRSHDKICYHDSIWKDSFIYHSNAFQNDSFFISKNIALL